MALTYRNQRCWLFFAKAQDVKKLWNIHWSASSFSVTDFDVSGELQVESVTFAVTKK